MLACHVSPLGGHIHDHTPLFRILVRFLWTIVNKDVAQFIRSCANFQLLNACYREAHQIFHTIESDTSFEVVFLDFWKAGEIPYQYGYHKIITYLYCITVFEIGASSGLK